MLTTIKTKLIMKDNKMVIKRIYDDTLDYEVGKDNVISIEPSNQGSKKVTMYKLTLDDGDLLFIGLLEHEVEYEE